MDMWKYFDITHRDHRIMNPMSMTKTQEMVDLLRLDDSGLVLDVACGKAEFLCLLAEVYDVRGVGVDASPFTFEEARKNVEARCLAERIEILNMDGAKYVPEEGKSFQLASCIGGSWIYGDHKGTIEALMKMTRPGGLVLVGEPFWRMDPDPEYLKMTGYGSQMYGSHWRNVKTGEDLGLTYLYSIVSSKDDWDRYEGLQWQAAERYAAQHPEDPDLEELLKKVRQSKETYLRWGRDCLGWAQYLFRKPR